MEEKNYKQKLLLSDRKRLSIDAVINVDALGDDYVELNSDAGKIIIEGSELKIEELNQEKRTVSIVGSICSIIYKSDKKSTSFISRWLK